MSDMTTTNLRGRACWYWSLRDGKWIGAKFHGVFNSQDGDISHPVAAIELESDQTMTSVSLENVCFATVPPHRTK